MKKELLRTAVAAATLLTIAIAGATSQQPPAGTPQPGVAATTGRGAAPTGTPTGVIRGRVVAADTGRPIRQAQVQIYGPGNAGAQVVATDEQGRFEITGITVPRFTLTAGKNGYVTMSFGQRRPSDVARQVEIANGQTVEQLDFLLPRASVIVAQVTDDLGAPIAGVRVVASQYQFNATSGQRILGSTIAGETKQAETDDRGEARISGLPSGDYYLDAAMASGHLNPLIAVSDSGRRYADPTYYPGTADQAEAQPVTVGAGQIATAAFHLTAIRASRVAGVVRAADGSIPADIVVQASQTVLRVGAFAGRNIPLRADGSFEWLDVMPGQYTLNVRPRTTAVAATSPPGHYASVTVNVVGQDVTDLRLTTATGSTIRGQYVFDVGAPPVGVRPDSFPLSLREGRNTGRSQTHDDWTFDVVDTVGPGVLRLQGNSGWFLKSVLLNGRDVTDTPTDFSQVRETKDLQVLLTQKRSEISGGVVDARNAPVSDYAVVVFAEDRERWKPQSRFVAAGRPDQTGRFRILGLPPGRYLAAAVESLETGQERDPELLVRLQAIADRLTVTDVEAKTISLRLTR